MKIFGKKLFAKENEKDLAEARQLAAARLALYNADRRDMAPAKPLKKSASPLTRLRWWH
jgi:hypothetical protein